MLTQRNLLTVGLLCAIIALLLGVALQQHRAHTDTRPTLHGTLLDTPREIPAFQLIGIDDHPFNNQSLKGQWTLLFFGFTHCGSICPTTLAEINHMVQLLNPSIQKPRIVLITVDPKEDTLARLKTYVTSFNPTFYGARGTNNATKRLADSLGVAYATVTRNGHQDIEHTGTLILFNPKGQLTAFFTMPHRAAWLASDYQALLTE